MPPDSVRVRWHDGSVPHDPSARPTLRLLRALSDGWEDAFQHRAVSEERWDDVQPLSSLRHPILLKCRNTFEAKPHDRRSRRPIACSRDLRLEEIRFSQWRAAIWLDDDGVQWIVAAGRAKGNHEDREDFYEILDRQCSTEEGRDALLPTDADRNLLKRETAARILTDWELSLQPIVARLLENAVTTGRSRTAIPHPIHSRLLTELELEVAIGADVEEFVLTFINHQQPGSPLAYALERRLLISIAPPEQDWDVGSGIYAAMEAPGHAQSQIGELRRAVDENRLLESTPGQSAHRAHRRHIGDAAVSGRALRALCGVFFVPRTDPEKLPCCTECEQTYNSLPPIRS